jgi:hypothetical protein
VGSSLVDTEHGARDPQRPLRHARRHGDLHLPSSDRRGILVWDRLRSRRCPHGGGAGIGAALGLAQVSCTALVVRLPGAAVTLSSV